MTPAGGGKACWYVREDADPALSPVKFPEQLLFDPTTLAAEHRKQLMQRKAILDGWLRACSIGFRAGKGKAQITRDYLLYCEAEHGTAPGERTLYRWNKDYRARGLAGLVDERWLGGEAEPVENDPFIEALKRLYLDQRRRSKRVCYEAAELLAEEKGWKLPSYRTACRVLDELPRALVLKQRFGEEAYVDDAEPFLQRDYSALASNEIWGADHHEFDVMVDAGGKIVRPWLTAWQDLRSRKIVGWYIAAHDPNTESILKALRPAVLSHGIPEKVQVDNGKDFDSHALQGRTKQQRRRGDFDPTRLNGVFGGLGIDARNVLPYHGQSKPIERFFRTLEDRFGRTFDTYCGNSPENKPDDLQAKLKAGRAPTLEEFRAVFSEWLECDYHTRGHLGDGMEGRSPAEAFDACLRVKRTAPEGLLDLLMLMPTRPVKVTQNGVAWQRLHYRLPDAVLMKHLGKQVILRVDPERVGTVSVWSHPDDRFIGVATDKRVPANASGQDLREAMAEKRRHRKLLKEYQEQRPRMAQDVTDLVIRSAIQKAGQKPKLDPEPPPSIRLHQSPLSDQMPVLQQAMQAQKLGMAAGAESYSFSEAAAAIRQANQEQERETESGDAFSEFSQALREFGSSKP